MAAGTMTITETTFASVKKIKCAWTSGTGDDEGTASGSTTHAYSGRLIGAVTIPGSGAEAPTALYDITVLDSDSVDVALGALLNRDTANTENVLEASMAGAAGCKLAVSVAGAGAANTGVLYLYIR
jgi:hypothetical protein